MADWFAQRMQPDPTVGTRPTTRPAQQGQQRRQQQQPPQLQQQQRQQQRQHQQQQQQHQPQLGLMTDDGRLCLRDPLNSSIHEALGSLAFQTFGPASWEVPLPSSAGTISPPPGLSLPADADGCPNSDEEGDGPKDGSEGIVKASLSKKRKLRRQRLHAQMSRNQNNISGPQQSAAAGQNELGIDAKAHPSQSPVQNVKGHVLKLSKHPQTAETVQHAFAQATETERVRLAEEFRGHLLDCARHTHANHVVQKCLVCVQEDQLRFFFTELSGYIVGLSQHVNGCRVIERWLQVWSPQSMGPVHQEVSTMVPTLARNTYGNHILQLVLETSAPKHQLSIFNTLRTDVLELSKDKYGSRVIEKALRLQVPKGRAHSSGLEPREPLKKMAAEHGKKGTPALALALALAPPPSPASSDAALASTSFASASFAGDCGRERDASVATGPRPDDALGEPGFCRDGSQSDEGSGSESSRCRSSSSSRRSRSQRSRSCHSEGEHRLQEALDLTVLPNPADLIRHRSPWNITLSNSLMLPMSELQAASRPPSPSSMPKFVDECSLAAARPSAPAPASASASTSGSVISSQGPQLSSCSTPVAHSRPASPTRSDVSTSFRPSPERWGGRLQTEEEEGQLQQQPQQQQRQQQEESRQEHEEEEKEVRRAQEALFEAFFAFPAGGSRCVLAVLAEHDIGNYVVQAFLQEARGTVRDKALAILMSGQPSKYLAGPLAKAIGALLEGPSGPTSGRSKKHQR